ncbi:MotA/TolQ/ExbB proton channel family protein [Celeribacter neptunius]|uniref:Biopolymer transport protein ExbB n=1 Tax=Celeribacter neptunius TaxID=588602 RepID=A0A1I3WTJ4_9RHOB|nr:MotA/TolQ/ExbB proton channel family protein [Celeribacter neptunius]SFK10964.1 biopolymer transport protein ExbB [Celeribacter neptunius]
MGTAQVFSSLLEFLSKGGASIWAIAVLSVLAMALILWKLWDLSALGAWRSMSGVERALELWAKGEVSAATDFLASRRGLRSRFLRAAMAAHQSQDFDAAAAESETTRIAKNHLARAKSGLRPLELIATIAPLLGLLGTVLGMIAAFQTLQTAGAKADPAMLAGGIWEALLTTAAGMAVAIPASIAFTGFEAVADRLRHEFEDMATRVFLRPRPSAEHAPRMAQAAE